MTVLRLVHPLELAVALRSRVAAALAARGRRWPRLAAAILAARGQAGLDRAAFAALLGIPVHRLTLLECGHLPPGWAPGSLVELMPEIDWAAVGIDADDRPMHRHPSAHVRIGSGPSDRKGMSGRSRDPPPPGPVMAPTSSSASVRLRAVGTVSGELGVARAEAVRVRPLVHGRHGTSDVRMPSGAPDAGVRRRRLPATMDGRG
jgi:hypothetical protein